MANTYFTDRVVQYPGRVTMTPTGNTNEYDLARAEGNVTEAGTPFNADAFNSIANQIIADAVAEAVPDAVAQALQAVGKYLVETGTSNGWTYEKYSDGTMKAWRTITTGSTWTLVKGDVYQNQTSLTLPAGMTFFAGYASPTVKLTVVIGAQVQKDGNNAMLTVHRLSGSAASVTYNIVIEGTYS